ncbi:MAG: cell division protein FtsZ [Deltaproteobacteria bacterium]|nr:cell division protein FtsZ [Deltaproteobacteria bacterium]
MAKFDIDTPACFNARIKVIGCGGGGGNALNTMMSLGVGGVDFIAANTDAQALRCNLAPVKIQLGSSLTRGLGAGADPGVGRQAALEDTSAVADVIAGADMVFITAGMGGGTGTGASPIVARIAKECGALTVGVVTKPFQFEGKRRMRLAKEGIDELREAVDTLITIPNDRLLSIAGKNTSIIEAFRMVDDVLCRAVKGISDLITTSGIINVDFADVRTIMSEKGMALMGTGTRSGDNRAVLAAQDAVSSPLLDNLSIEGARGVLINITGPSTMTLAEVTEAAGLIQETAHEDANIIFGQVIDDAMGDAVSVTVIATGFGDAKADAMPLEVVRMAKVEEEAVDRDVPAFLRKKKDPFAGPSISRVSRVVNSDIEFDDEYDIPTFLRRQAD